MESKNSLLFCDIVRDCYNLKSGNILEYKNKIYYFRPNGSVAYLYSTLINYKKKKSKYKEKCIRRSKLNGCNIYENTGENIETEESSLSSSDDENFFSEWNNRRVLIYNDDDNDPPT